MTESQLIDHLLDELKTGYDQGALPDIDFRHYPTAINKMRALGLVEGEGRSKRLLQKGYDVLDAGGFDAWQAANRQREDQQLRATLDQAKTGWISARATKIGTIIAAIAVAVTIFQTCQH